MSYATNRGNRFIAVALLTLLLTALLGTVGIPRAEAVEQSSVINFESGLSAGDIVSTVSVGSGMSGANLGTVSIYGTNPDVAGNAAMVFDATCGGQTVAVGDPAFDPTMCSGDDPDLYFPLQGNTLIITEDGDSTDPDDSGGTGTYWTFDFTAWGPGTVTVKAVTVSDIDLDQTGGTVTVFDASSAVLGVFFIPDIGDNEAEDITINTSGVATMVVAPAGSGQIDDIQITTDSPIIDLELTKDVDPAQVQVGEQTTFTISVVNQGPDDATGVAVTDTLPAGLTYVSDNAGGAYNAATGVWTIGDLAVGASVSMEFNVTVDDIGVFINVAEVTAANETDIDSVPGDGEGDDWDDAVVTAVSQVRASSAIGDYVWYDKDADRVQDPSETGVSGATVRLTNQATNEVLTTVTDANGKYLFSGLDAGTYVVEVLKSTLPDNHELTTVGTYTVTVLDDQSFLDADFGIVEVLPITGMELDMFAMLGLLFLGLGGVFLGLERGRKRLPIRPMA